MMPMPPCSEMVLCRVFLKDRMDIDLQGYQPAIVFINGEYWGIQNIQRKNQ